MTAERRTYPPKDESWMDRANCLGVETSLFFPERGGPSDEAKAVCAGCQVKARCLEYALTEPVEKWGVWAGTSERERRRIRARRKLRRWTG